MVDPGFRVGGERPRSGNTNYNYNYNNFVKFVCNNERIRTLGTASLGMTGKVHQLRTMGVHAVLLRKTIVLIVFQLIDFAKSDVGFFLLSNLCTLLPLSDCDRDAANCFLVIESAMLLITYYATCCVTEISICTNAPYTSIVRGVL